MAATEHSSAQKTESADKENAPPVDAQGGSTSDTSPAMPLEPESDNLERLIDEELESLHPARPDTGVIILSTDSDLVEVVKSSGGAHHVIDSVEEWSQLLESVGEGRANIVLLDADLVDDQITDKQIGDLVSELRGLANPPIVSIAASRAAARKLVDLESDNTIHRLLTKPASPGPTGFLLESATELYIRTGAPARKGEEPEPRAVEEQEPVQSAAEDQGPGKPAAEEQEPEQLAMEELKPRQPVAIALFVARWETWLVVAVPASLMVAAIVVLGLQRVPGANPRDTGVAETFILPGESEGPIADDVPREEAAAPLLDIDSDISPGVSDIDPAATQQQAVAPATDVGRFEEPVSDSAAAFYAAVLAGHESNPQLDVLIEALFAEAESALLEGDVEKAVNAVAHIRRVRPSGGRLLFLETQIERELTAAAISEAAAAAEAFSSEAPSSGELESLLTIARARLEQGQISTPVGDSAFDYFERAAALDSASVEPEDTGNPELQILRADLTSALTERARLALERGDVEQAGPLIDQAEGLGIDGETLALLNLSYSAARQADFLATGTERLESGRLIAPEQDNALYYLSSARTDNPDLFGLDEVWSSLLVAMEATAERELDAGNWLAAETWLAALETADAGSTFAGELRGEIEFRRVQAEYLANPTPTDELEVLQTGTAVYPRPARIRNVEGWVELEFVVGADGVPTNPTVVAAEPPGTFDAAALDAASQYRYAPFVREGRVYERRVQLRIRFSLLD